MKIKSGINRRRFLKTSALSIVGAGILNCSKKKPAGDEDITTPAKIKGYRILGKTGFKVSDIGAGKPDNPGVLRALMEAGVNYIDTAESYENGNNEAIIGDAIEAIKDLNRKSIFITSKLKMDGEPTKEQIITRVEKCLMRLKSNYLDCMMIHSCPNVKTVYYQPFHEAMDQLKKDKKVRFVGISNHGGMYSEKNRESMADVLMAAVKDGRFDVIYIAYNFLKQEQSEEILNACHEKNIGTVVIKIDPVNRFYSEKRKYDKEKEQGKLTQGNQEKFEALKQKYEEAQNFLKKNNLTDEKSIRSAAYRFVLSNENVNCALFNFVNFDLVESVLKISGTKMSSIDKKILTLLKQGCGDLYCRHACGICEKNCPYGVPVNTIMRYNYYFETKGREKYAIKKYWELPTSKADRCFTCNGECEKACPYGVPIQGLLWMANSNLTIG